MRNRKEPRVVRVFAAVTLQGAEIIRVAQLVSQAFEDVPITARPLGANFPFQMAPQVGGDAIVVEQRVVHVEKENDLAWRVHGFAPAPFRTAAACCSSKAFSHRAIAMVAMPLPM